MPHKHIVCNMQKKKCELSLGMINLPLLCLAIAHTNDTKYPVDQSKKWWVCLSSKICYIPSMYSSFSTHYDYNWDPNRSTEPSESMHHNNDEWYAPDVLLSPHKYYVSCFQNCGSWK